MPLVRSITTSPHRYVPIGVALLAALLIAAALLVDPADRGGSDPGSNANSSPAKALVEAPAVAPAAAGGVGTEPAAGSDAASGARETVTEGGEGEVDRGDVARMTSVPELEPRIVRFGTIELRLKRGSFEEGWSDTQAIAGASGGYVLDASRSGAGDGPRMGTITMRVPSERFDRAVDRLRDLAGAKVQRLDVSSQDVTQEYVDVRSRLTHARAVEGRLLSLLAQTKSVSEVLAVQLRLDQVQEAIEISKGRLDYLQKMTSMSTIVVSMREPGAGPARDDDEDSVLAKAWDDAGERFAENIAGAIVWMGGALPALVLLAIIGFVARISWTRRIARSRDHATVVTPREDD